MNWALRPVKDSLGVIFGARLKEKNSEKKREQLQEKIRQVFETDTISIEAVAHMRGRSIADTFVIIDEAQNLTPRQLKTLLSRTTDTSKVVLLGDPQQVDKPFLDSRTNGLSVVIDKLKNSTLSWNITMLPSECERSELALEIITKI